MKDYTNQLLENFKKERYTHLLWTIFRVACSCHVTCAFQSESTLYSCLNLKELLAWSRREIWSLSDCNWTWTQNHLVRKRTLDHLAKLAYKLHGSELSGSGFESSCSHYIEGDDLAVIQLRSKFNKITHF